MIFHFFLLFQVSLDSRVREIINRNMVEPSRHTFDEAQLQIYTLMHRDSYPRFVNSQQYRSLVEKFLKGSTVRSQPPPQNNSTGASIQSAPQSSSSNSYHRTSMS
jgi:Regulator of G protein signaling domain